MSFTASLRYLNTGIFSATILFSHGFSYKEIMKALKKTKAKEWYDGIYEDKVLLESGKSFALGREVTENGVSKKLFYIILTEEFDFSDYAYCKLAHEVLHICQFILPDILNRDREYECEAYLHTHIMMQCLNQIRGNG